MPAAIPLLIASKPVAPAPEPEPQPAAAVTQPIASTTTGAEAAISSKPAPAPAAPSSALAVNDNVVRAESDYAAQAEGDVSFVTGESTDTFVSLILVLVATPSGTIWVQATSF
jgi:hypothetical protein